MKEIEAILNHLSVDPAAEAGAIATVVRVEGSSYRHTGARMLVTPNGERIGSVSGGCLETDVAERAMAVAAGGEPDYVLYDSRSTNGDLVTELGCGGAVGIVIQPVAQAIDALRFCAQRLHSRTGGVLATVYEGHRIGAWAGFDAPGTEVPGYSLTECPSDSADRDAHQFGWQSPSNSPGPGFIFAAGSASIPFPLRGGSARSAGEGSSGILYEPIVPPIALLLYGASRDAAALCALAARLGWQATVADRRLRKMDLTRFSRARTLEVPPEEVIEHVDIDSRTAAVAMTHRYSDDAALLVRLIQSPAPYIGVIGSRGRALRLLEEIATSGAQIDDFDRKRIHMPAGLNIGAEGPEEIAISIAAEILSVFAP